MNIFATVWEYGRLGLPSDVFKFPKIYKLQSRSHESLAACWHGHARICKVRVSTSFRLQCTFSKSKHKGRTFLWLHHWITELQQVKYKCQRFFWLLRRSTDLLQVKDKIRTVFRLHHQSNDLQQVEHKFEKFSWLLRRSTDLQEVEHKFRKFLAALSEQCPGS